MFKRDWIMSLNINNKSTLNSGHNWEDLHIQLRNQQICTSNNHNQIKGGPLESGFCICFIVDLLMQHMFGCEIQLVEAGEHEKQTK